MSIISVSAELLHERIQKAFILPGPVTEIRQNNWDRELNRYFLKVDLPGFGEFERVEVLYELVDGRPRLKEIRR